MVLCSVLYTHIKASSDMPLTTNILHEIFLVLG